MRDSMPRDAALAPLVTVFLLMLDIVGLYETLR